MTQTVSGATGERQGVMKQLTAQQGVRTTTDAQTQVRLGLEHVRGCMKVSFKSSDFEETATEDDDYRSTTVPV